MFYRVAFRNLLSPNHVFKAELLFVLFSLLDCVGDL